MLELIMLAVFSGIPYYVVEQQRLIPFKKLFFVATALTVIGCLIGWIGGFNGGSAFTNFLVIAASIYWLKSALQTANLYRIASYVLFVNAPAFMLFGSAEACLYLFAIVACLSGVYIMAVYYERVYGSANYRQVTGISLVTPFAGFVLTVYFTALALYPPFPNSIALLNGLLHADTGLMWYAVTVTVFFGNFLIAVRIMARTVFGKPNAHVHYVDVRKQDRLIHFGIFALLAILSIVALQEVLS